MDWGNVAHLVKPYLATRQCGLIEATCTHSSCFIPTSNPGKLEKRTDRKKLQSLREKREMFEYSASEFVYLKIFSCAPTFIEQEREVER